MANTIRLKRGLSSNVVSASLMEGELALTTDTHELYTVDGNNNKVRIQEELIEDIACGKAETIRYTVDASAIQETLDNLPLRLDGIVTININEGTGGDYNITIPKFYGNGRINITGCSTSNYEDESSVSSYELGQIFITGVSTIVNITGIKFKKISVSTCKRRVTIKYCHSNEDTRENAYNTGHGLSVSSCEDEVIFDNCTFDNKRSIIKFLDSNVKMIDCWGSYNRFLSGGQASLGKLELKNNGMAYEKLVDEFWETDGKSSNALIISNGKIISEVDIDLKTINDESIIGVGNIEIPRGESGVYIGEEEPTDSDVNVWIDPGAEGLIVPTKTSELVNDSEFIDKEYLSCNYYLHDEEYVEITVSGTDIQSHLNSMDKYLNKNIYISVDTQENPIEELVIPNFFGPGRLTIGDCSVGTIRAEGVESHLEFYNITFSNTQNTCYFTDCKDLELASCKFTGTGKPASMDINVDSSQMIMFNRTKATVTNCEFNDLGVVCSILDNSEVCMKTCKFVNVLTLLSTAGKTVKLYIQSNSSPRYNKYDHIFMDAVGSTINFEVWKDGKLLPECIPSSAMSNYYTKSEIDSKGYATTTYVDNKVSGMVTSTSVKRVEAVTAYPDDPEDDVLYVLIQN